MDYDPLLNDVMIPAGHTNATVNIPINDDDVLETNENFTAILSTSSRFNPVIDREATVTIMDNDCELWYRNIVYFCHIYYYNIMTKLSVRSVTIKFKSFPWIFYHL